MSKNESNRNIKFIREKDIKVPQQRQHYERVKETQKRYLTGAILLRQAEENAQFKSFIYSVLNENVDDRHKHLFNDSEELSLLSKLRTKFEIFVRYFGSKLMKI